MKSTWIKTLIGLAAFVGLFWLLSRIGWTNILLHLQKVGIAGFLILCLIGMMEACFDALALQQATLGRVGFWSLLCLNQAGSAINIIVPGEAGEVYKASLLAQHLPKRESTASILIWNVAFRLSKPIVILLAASVAFFFSPAGHEIAQWSLLLAVLHIGLYLLITIGLKRRLVVKTLTALTHPFPFFKRLLAHAEEAEERSAHFGRRHVKPYLLILLFQILARMAGFLVVWLALSLLHSQYSFALCALIFAAMELVTYLLGLFPTRIGVTEGSTYLLFELLKLGGSFGTIFQVVLRMKQLMVTLLFLIGGFLTRIVSKPLPLEEPL